MSRRGSPAVQILVVIVIVLFFLYGFYSYHEQHTRLKHVEEVSEKFKQKAESLSAQLQVLYEHKTRLESAVQKEKELHEETKKGLELQIKELRNEKNQLDKEKESVAAEVESLKKAADVSKADLEKAELEVKHLQQQWEKEKTKLQDDVANCNRKYEECRSRTQPKQIDENLNQNTAERNSSAVHKSQQQPENFQIQEPGNERKPVQSLHASDAKQSANIEPPAKNPEAVEKSAADDDVNEHVAQNIPPAVPKTGRGSPVEAVEPHSDTGSQQVAESNENQPDNNHIAPLDGSRDVLPQNPSQDVVHPAENPHQENVNNQENVNSQSQHNQQDKKRKENKDEDYEGDIEKSQLKREFAGNQIENPVANADNKNNEAAAAAAAADDENDGAGL